MPTERVRPNDVAPAGMKAVVNIEAYIQKCGLDHSLIELVNMRASQINGCAYCLGMHSRDARARGESEQRLYLLDAWHEADLYSPRERAALAWTDAVTRIADTHAPDEVYEELRVHFSEKEIADLTLVIGVINLWNRLAISFRTRQPSTTAQSAENR